MLFGPGPLFFSLNSELSEQEAELSKSVLTRRLLCDPLKARCREWITTKASEQNSGLTKLRPRLGQSNDCTVFVAGSLCGLWKPSSSPEWLSACSPTSLTSNWLLGGVFRSWTISYLRHSSVELSPSDLQSGNVRALWEVMLCSLILKNWSPSQLGSWSYLRRLELETRQRLFVARCEVCVLNHGSRLLGPEACPF